MSSETDTRTDIQLQSIDAATLTPLVRQALGTETVEVVDWHHQHIHGGANRNVHRFGGTARDGSKLVSWSIVLKSLELPSEDVGVFGSRRWMTEQREMLAYQSGLLDDIPGDLTVPRCYGITQRSPQIWWLWLEEIVDRIGPQWPLAQYGVAARHLSQFNGAYLSSELSPAPRPLPSYPWLSSGRVKRRLEFSESAMDQIQDTLQHPLGRRACPPDVLSGISRLWAERDRFVGALERLPRTLCHHDTQRRNLFARRDAERREQSVAIDWSWLGTGAAGEEIAALVWASINFFAVDPANAPELDTIVFDSYLKGLRDAGWRGDPWQVRIGQTARSVMSGSPSLEPLLALC